jgi:ATP-dependent DNA helicase RecQ
VVEFQPFGLLLLSAHRAKGLEFDHVAVLDGGWERIDRKEDRAAPRRLYYVAMTRARHTLTLARFEAGHPLLDSLPETACLLRREAPSLPPAPAELTRRYQRLKLKDVDLSFAGRRDASNPLHAAIAALSPGDKLRLRPVAAGEEMGRAIDDLHGRAVVKLAKAYRPPPGMRCIEARVAAVIVWRSEDSEPEYREGLRCESWEVVVPELVFEPELM